MHPILQHPLLRSIACAFGVIALTATAPAAPTAPAPTDIQPLLARPELAAYRGWLKFLRFEAETAAARDGADSPIAREKAVRLADWAGRIAADPGLLAKLRDVQEWAYESAADGSGQPFKIAIPTDYDPVRPAAMSVYMHGWSGNHLEHSVGLASRPGTFQIAVLGRSRGGGYRSLSEADVLHVVDYIQAHWSIDPNRIHLNGGSMGGSGTYRLGSRFPHRWASGRPTCGFASFVPVENMITYPIYATHSDDDPVVSALHDRGPLARLRELGGQVIYDETTGYGHAAWDYAEGNARGAAWEERQVRPDSKAVRRIAYTATDGVAARGWWAEVAEWGASPRPAQFLIRVGSNNTLFADLKNVDRLRIRVQESPLDRSDALTVVVDGGLPITHPAPLPDTLILARGPNGWSLETQMPSVPFRLHTPGSAQLLYNGDPILIVYGTRGTEAETAAMKRAAEFASKSSNPAWMPETGEAGTDGVPHLHNLYGNLPTKPDRDVTAADMARCHLVLIGTAAQNTIVEQLAARLPVSFADGRITCSDGFALEGQHRALGLVHYNPAAPDRLIFWVASADAAAYAPASPVPTLMSGGLALAPAPFGADLLVMDAAKPTIVLTRSFDSHWRFIAQAESSRTLPETARSAEGLARVVGDAIRQAAGTEFAFVVPIIRGTDEAVIPGTTRVSDLQAFYHFGMIGVLEVSGAELVRTIEAAAATSGLPMVLSSREPFAAAAIDAQATYRVALTGDAAGAMAAALRAAPGTYRLSDVTVADAIGRFVAR